MILGRKAEVSLMTSNNFEILIRNRRTRFVLSTVLLALTAFVTFNRVACASLISEFRIFGKTNVMIGVDSQILSGKVGSFTNVHTNAGSGVNFPGDIVSGGDIDLDGNNFVHASMYATNLVAISDGDTAIDGSIHASKVDFTNAAASGGVSVGGIVKYGTSVTAPQNCSTCTLINGVPTPPDLPVFPAAAVFSAGGANQTNPGALLPGTYGAVSQTSGLLTLSSGIYKMDSLSLSGSGQMKFDVTGGPILLDIVGNGTLGSSKDVSIVGGDDTSVFVEVHGDWSHGGGGTWNGTIFAPFGQIHVGSGSSTFTYNGAMWANDIDIEHSVTIGGGPPPPGSGNSPEPSTMLMAVLGVLGVGVLGRRKLSR
jgi:PEP-CTERM motif-containing protein